MIPDKIYFPEDGLPSYIDWDGSPIRTKQVDDSDVCYIRKDALLEWLKQKIKDYWADDENTMGIYPYALEEVIDKINEL